MCTPTGEGHATVRLHQHFLLLPGEHVHCCASCCRAALDEHAGACTHSQCNCGTRHAMTSLDGCQPASLETCLLPPCAYAAAITTCGQNAAAHLAQSCQHQHACPVQLLSLSWLPATAQQLPAWRLACCRHVHARLLSGVWSRTQGKRKCTLPGRLLEKPGTQHQAAACPGAPAQLQEKERESCNRSTRKDQAAAILVVVACICWSSISRLTQPPCNTFADCGSSLTTQFGTSFKRQRAGRSLMASNGTGTPASLARLASFWTSRSACKLCSTTIPAMHTC